MTTLVLAQSVADAKRTSMRLGLDAQIVRQPEDLHGYGPNARLFIVRHWENGFAHPVITAFDDEFANFRGRIQHINETVIKHVLRTAYGDCREVLRPNTWKMLTGDRIVLPSSSAGNFNIGQAHTFKTYEMREDGLLHAVAEDERGTQTDNVVPAM